MFGDLFLFYGKYRTFHSACQGFRPHVWGSFFMARCSRKCGQSLQVFVPMFGDLFLFAGMLMGAAICAVFSSPCLGIFFYPYGSCANLGMITRVFVPMFGDLFLFDDIRDYPLIGKKLCFRPHVWGSFFMMKDFRQKPETSRRFRPHVWGSFFIIGIDERFPTKAGNSFRPHVWGSFFIACQRRPIPWGSAERFAAGIGHGIHGALSSGIAVPIFSGLMGIGGDLMKRLHQILKVLRVLRCAKCMLNSRHSCDNKRILEPSSP